MPLSLEDIIANAARLNSGGGGGVSPEPEETEEEKKKKKKAPLYSILESMDPSIYKPGMTPMPQDGPVAPVNKMGIFNKMSGSNLTPEDPSNDKAGMAAMALQGVDDQNKQAVIQAARGALTTVKSGEDPSSKSVEELRAADPVTTPSELSKALSLEGMSDKITQKHVIYALSSIIPAFVGYAFGGVEGGAVGAGAGQKAIEKGIDADIKTKNKPLTPEEFWLKKKELDIRELYARSKARAIDVRESSDELKSEYQGDLLDLRREQMERLDEQKQRMMDIMEQKLKSPSGKQMSEEKRELYKKQAELITAKITALQKEASPKSGKELSSEELARIQAQADYWQAKTDELIFGKEEKEKEPKLPKPEKSMTPEELDKIKAETELARARAEALGKPKVVQQKVAAAKAPAAPKPPTQSQSTAANYYSALKNANEDLEAVLARGYDPTSYKALGQNIVGGIPFVGKTLQDDNTKSFIQARRAFINAIKRRESGAAVSGSETEEYNRTYFPEPGDGPEVLAQKKRARLQAIENLRAEGAGATEKISPIKKESVISPKSNAAMEWLKKNPDHPKAAAVREKLKKEGVLK